MDKAEKYCVHEKYTIKDAIAIIQNNFSRCAIVVNDNHKVIGVFSEGDVLRAILDNIDVHTPVKSVIKPSFKYLREADLPRACELFKKYGITLIPVIDNEFNLRSVITIFDIMDNLGILHDK